MPQDHAAEVRSNLLQTITIKDPSQVGQYADRAQKLSPDRPDLTVLCDFSQAQKMRRLMILPLKAWKLTEIHWAEYALAKIGELRQNPSLQATLALACFGVVRPGLEDAFTDVQRMGKPAKKPKAQPEPKPEPEGEDDEELDPQTRADLDAVLREAEKLASKTTPARNGL